MNKGMIICLKCWNVGRLLLYDIYIYTITICALNVRMLEDCVWCVYDSRGVITCYFGIITLWLRIGVCDKLIMC